MPDHKDPQHFAWALYTSENYEEAADKLGCSTGTISVWKNKHGDKLEEYSESDFTEKKADPDKVDQSGIEQSICEAYPYEVDTSGSIIRGSEFGFIVDINGKPSDVAGKDLNPFIAISEHKLTDEWINRCQDNDVGLIVVSDDSIKVLEDSSIANGSGMRALLTPDDASTRDKYLSTAWLEHVIDNEYTEIDIARECKLMPRTVESTLDRFELDTS